MEFNLKSNRIQSNPLPSLRLILLSPIISSFLLYSYHLFPFSSIFFRFYSFSFYFNSSFIFFSIPSFFLTFSPPPILFYSILLLISFLSSPLASLLTYRHEHCLHSHRLRIVHAVNLIPQLYNRGWTTSRYVWTCQLENHSIIAVSIERFWLSWIEK